MFSDAEGCVYTKAFALWREEAAKQGFPNGTHCFQKIAFGGVFRSQTVCDSILNGDFWHDGEEGGSLWIAINCNEIGWFSNWSHEIHEMTRKDEGHAGTPGARARVEFARAFASELVPAF